MREYTWAVVLYTGKVIEIYADGWQLDSKNNIEFYDMRSDTTQAIALFPSGIWEYVYMNDYNNPRIEKLVEFEETDESNAS